jgi:DNA polymerase III subunit delta'
MTFFPWHLDEFERLAQQRARLPHALLLTGPVGIGKRVFARAVAAGMLCESPVAAFHACGQCQACRWLAGETHPDFRQLQPEAAEPAEDDDTREKRKKQDISIAQVRSLGDFINISAHRNGVKVVLIQPAEAMNANAANALLKSLEEPPPNTHFLLVSDRPHMLPATIRSRCRQLPLRPPSLTEATQWLAANGCTQPELALAQAGGAPVRAAEIDTPEYWSLRKQFLDGLTARRVEPLSVAERFAGHPIPQLIHWLQRWTYDLASVSLQQRLRYNPDRSDDLRAAAGRMRSLEILRFHRELVRFQRVINHPLNPRLLLENMLLRYAQLLQT